MIEKNQAPARPLRVGALLAGIFGMFGATEQRRTIRSASELFSPRPTDPNRPARVARIKASAESRRRRRNSQRLLTWTGASVA